MPFSPDPFRAWPTKPNTFPGMPGVGKTHISTMLHGHDGFHYLFRRLRRRLFFAVLPLTR